MARGRAAARHGAWSAPGATPPPFDNSKKRGIGPAVRLRWERGEGTGRVSQRQAGYPVPPESHEDRGETSGVGDGALLAALTRPSGDALLQVLATLANPHRLRVLAALAAERNYVSQLARELDISRALLQVHLRKLQAAGLVSADIEVSEDGKAMKFYEVTPFALHLTPQTVMAAVRTLHASTDLEAEVRR